MLYFGHWAGVILMAVLLIGTVVAIPAAASPEIGIEAANAEGEPEESVTIEVAVANGHENAPAEDLTVVVDTELDNLVLNRTNATTSVGPNSTKKVAFELEINNNVEPGNYTIESKVLRGENPEANATSTISITDPTVNNEERTDRSEKTDESEEIDEEQEECTTFLDWVSGDIGWGEWDTFWGCEDDDDSGFWDWLFN